MDHQPSCGSKTRWVRHRMRDRSLLQRRTRQALISPVKIGQGTHRGAGGAAFAQALGKNCSRRQMRGVPGCRRRNGSNLWVGGYRQKGRQPHRTRSRGKEAPGGALNTDRNQKRREATHVVVGADTGAMLAVATPHASTPSLMAGCGPHPGTGRFIKRTVACRRRCVHARGNVCEIGAPPLPSYALSREWRP